MTSATIESKLCNALIEDAQPDFALYCAIGKVAGVDGHKEIVEAVLKGFRTFYGGLWVGGTAALTTASLSFTPNAVNKLVHKGDYSLEIPLSDISALSPEFGLISGIIRVTTPRGIAKLRCFGAKAFLSRIAHQQQLALAAAHVER